MELVYSQLCSEQREFRLLILQPRLPSQSNNQFPISLICCKLLIACRGSAPDYQALSYQWGDANDKVAIHVNSCEYYVNRNLYLALDQIRHPHDEVTIWIDAICINQADLKEKSDQVLHMTEVYASAKCTIVWLGPSGDGSDQIIQRCNEVGSDLIKQKIEDCGAIRSLADLIVESVLLSNETMAEKERYEYLEKRIQAELDDFISQDLQNLPKTWSLLTSLKRLLSRNYWTRVWVLQELVVSANLLIQCGGSRIKGSEFYASLFSFYRIRPKIIAVLSERCSYILDNSELQAKECMLAWYKDRCREGDSKDYGESVPEIKEFRFISTYNRAFQNLSLPPVNIFGMRQTYQEHQRKPKEDNLTLFRLLGSIFVDKTAESTDPRDRVFAMLGMANDKSILGLVPNYDSSISDIMVYEEAARAIIGNGDVDILSLSQHRPEWCKRKSGEQHVPSWVPDLLSPITRPGGQFPWDTHFTASENKPFERSPGFEGSLPRQVGLCGWVIDTIEQVAPAWEKPDAPSNEGDGYVRKYLADTREICELPNIKFNLTSHNVYSISFDRQSAHFLIPVADQEQHGIKVCRGENYSSEAYADLISEETLSLESAMYVETLKYQRFRRPFISNFGYVGLTPNSSGKGDLLVIFCGAKFPYCLRDCNDGTYTLVGEAYVHGIMYGEYMESAGEMREFTLK